MVIEFDAVQPIGARTCCDLPGKTGKYSHEWLDQDVPEYVQEFEELLSGKSHASLSRRHHLDALGQIRSLKRRAGKGQLRVGKDRSFPARVIRIVPYLLELRPALSAPRVFRLYYAEPKEPDGALLPLVLSTKPASSDNSEQNASIEDAKARSRTWTMYKVIGGSK